MVKINYKKATWVGLVWSITYFSFVLYYVFQDLGFNLLSPTQWESTYIAFISAQWAIDSKESALLLLTILLLFPVWIFGWMAFYKIKYHFPFFKKKKEETFKRELIMPSQKQKFHMPVKLRAQSSAFKSSYSAANTPQNQPSSTTPPSEQPIKNTDIADIVKLADSFAVEVFQNVALDDQKIPVAISTDDTAALLFFIDKPNAYWTIDIVEDSDWYSAGLRIPSPVTAIKKAAESLKLLEPDSQIIPAIVVTDGQIMDADSVFTYCHFEGVSLLRFNNGGPDSIPSLESFMAENFPKKES